MVDTKDIICGLLGGDVFSMGTLDRNIWTIDTNDESIDVQLEHDYIVVKIYRQMPLGGWYKAGMGLYYLADPDLHIKVRKPVQDFIDSLL
jgi:hypothetical protein